MSNYQIIDEPKPKKIENFIVDPIIILLASIFIPFILNPPMFGKYWMPIVWLLANGYFLGSSTIWKEVIISFIGSILLVGLIILFLYFYQNPGLGDFITPYLRIIIQATLFLTLYLIVFTQANSYSIHEYLKEQRDDT